MKPKKKGLKLAELGSWGLRSHLHHIDVQGEAANADIEAKYEGKGYGDFKSDLAEIVGEAVEKIQERYNYYINTKELDDLLDKGRERAKIYAQRKLKKIYHKLGLGRY